MKIFKSTLQPSYDCDVAQVCPVKGILKFPCWQHVIETPKTQQLADCEITFRFNVIEQINNFT